DRPRRLFDDVTGVARAAGLLCSRPDHGVLARRGERLCPTPPRRAGLSVVGATAVPLPGTRLRASATARASLGVHRGSGPPAGRPTQSGRSLKRARTEDPSMTDAATIVSSLRR